MSNKQNSHDARVVINMNPYGIETYVGSYDSYITELIDGMEKHHSKKSLKRFHKYLKQNLPKMDKEFTDIAKSEGAVDKDTKITALVLEANKNKPGLCRVSTEVVDWAEFCNKCVDFAVAELLLYETPIAIVHPGVFEDDKVRNLYSNFELPTMKDVGLLQRAHPECEL